MERTIAGLRRDVRLNRKEYAVEVGIKESSLARYETFKQVPPVDQAIKIARFHELPVEDIRWTE